MPKAREENSKPTCSSFNSDVLVTPDFDISFASVQGNLPKKKVPSKKNTITRKENLQEQNFYGKYLRSVYLKTIMEDKYSEEKSEIENNLSTLTKELELQKQILKKSSIRLKELSSCTEKELYLKNQNENFSNIMDTLDMNLLKNSKETTNRLNAIRQTVPTVAIEVPQNTSEMAEFQNIMNDIVNGLNMINGITRPHIETYSDVHKALGSIIKSQETTSSDIEDFRSLKSSVKEDLLFHCSHEKSKALEKEFEQSNKEGCDTFNILKDFYESMKEN